MVVRMNSICVLLSLVVNLNWTLHQMDVSNAFLYGDLTNQVFMEQPPDETKSYSRLLHTVQCQKKVLNLPIYD